MSEIGLLRSDIVACNLCLGRFGRGDIFILSFALNIDGGYAANSKANTSLKLISRELASRPMTRA